MNTSEIAHALAEAEAKASGAAEMLSTLSRSVLFDDVLLSGPLAEAVEQGCRLEHAINLLYRTAVKRKDAERMAEIVATHGTTIIDILGFLRDRRGEKIECVKMARAQAGDLGLLEAKLLVEYVIDVAGL